MQMKLVRTTGILALGLALLSGLSAPTFAPALYTGTGDPTAGEQYVLEIINRARSNPFAEGTRLGIDITEGLSPTDAALVAVKPPLAMNASLLASARGHSSDMWTRNYFAHNAPAPSPSTPDQRMTTAGYVFTAPYGWGENIAASSSGTPAQLEDNLMIDGGVAGRGHRKNLLDIYAGSPFREVGIGYYSGATVQSNALKDLLTQDFARSFGSGPYLVGVVFDDTTGSSTYSTSNGCAGVTISLNPAGAYYAVTATAGGYSFPIGTSGTIFVNATGGVFGASVITKAVTLTGENVKVDFKKSDLSIVDSDSDGLPDSWEMTHFGNLTQGPTGDPDGDGFSNLAEFNAGTDPMDAGSKPVTPAPPAGTTTKGGGGGGGGGCGLTGLEAVLLLALLRRRRPA
jgi:hypothetical protein